MTKATDHLSLRTCFTLILVYDCPSAAAASSSAPLDPATASASSSSATPPAVAEVSGKSEQILKT